MSAEYSVLRAAINLIEARSSGQVTEKEWLDLVDAVREETGLEVDHRTDDEKADSEPPPPPKKKTRIL